MGTKKGQIDQFIKENTNKHKCKCGCGNYIIILRHHYNVGIPDYIRGHILRTKKGKKHYNYKPEIDIWIEENTDKHLCKCGCNEYIKILRSHYNAGIPNYILRHYIRTHNPSNNIDINIKQSEAAYRRYEKESEHEKSSIAQLIRYNKMGAVEKQQLVNQETWDNTTGEDRIIHSQHVSAGKQGILYDEWEDYASEQKYCPDFNEECKESNREKYDRMCFITGLPEEKNINKNGKQIKLAVHHVDMDKWQGCDGIKWKLVPLCMEWHHKVHNELWEARITWLLNNVWN